MTETFLRGHLVIYVDGYKYHYAGLTHLIAQDGKHFAVPDQLMPAPVDEIASMNWWLEGWAVGDNQRDRLCKRTGSKALKKFFDFDEAVQFAYTRQQKCKKQQHVLVYVAKNAKDQEQRYVVRSADEIEAINARIDLEKQEIEIEKNRLVSETKIRFPELDLLTNKFGPSKGWRMSDFLFRVRATGREQILTTMSKSTMYRYISELEKAGVDVPA